MMYILRHSHLDPIRMMLSTTLFRTFELTTAIIFQSKGKQLQSFSNPKMITGPILSKIHT
ncbi:MAG: hypothetical protein ACTSWC_01570 [Promethearchaeota archaeon]